MSNYVQRQSIQQHHQQNQMGSSVVYTHQLPFGTRREFCQLLDVDNSWQILGGHYLGYDATNLTLIGHAVKRHESPTEELLKSLDSGNVRVSLLCHYLRAMNHYRALEILKPFIGFSLGEATDLTPNGQHNNRMSISSGTTLNTPTHSFSGQQPSQQQFMALMDVNNEYEQLFEQQQKQQQVAGQTNLWQNNQDHHHQGQLPMQHNQQQQQQPPPPVKCHRSNIDNIKKVVGEEQDKDPGEEIVRMACANNRKRTSISDQEVVNQLRLIMQINYNELKLASNDFSDTNILGNGGFASVYHGNWKGTDVAIKRLKCNLMDQALNELTILNSYRIDNILPIYGISIDGPEACLVYQFMSNGSLEDRLSCKKDTQPLTWNQRALIGEGVAKGLYYLHTLRDKPLVHGDVKSANVLLDSQFIPKLGDFGLARQVFKGKNPQTELCTHCTVSSIHGTSVYLPPEYLRHKILSPAVDVYSYGIVLLEMATGKRAYDGKRLLIDMVEDETKSMSEGLISHCLKDPRLNDDTQIDLKIWFELLIKLGLNCAHKIKKKRPDMGNVLNKFVEFRQVNPSAQIDLNQCSRTSHNQSNFGLVVATQTNNINNNNNNNNNNNVAGGQSTARTLTPDLTALAENRHPLTSGANPGLIYRQQGRLHNQVNNNSNLMSVEELNEPRDNQATNGNEQGTGTAGPEAGAVDAMIPLLTELGVKQE